jgi:succinoglycan biosynthesis protein ExoO
MLAKDASGVALDSESGERSATKTEASPNFEESTPTISVIVANYNGASFLPDLLASLQRQSSTSIEIIIVDDASTDGSVSVVEGAAAADPRIILDALAVNSGPAAARNRGLAHARGEWVAIVDCDDFVHPFRFERLLEMANKTGADIVADNLFVFHDGGESAPSLFLSGRRARTATRVTLEDYIRENRVFSATPALGYLKPLIRRSEIERLGLRYNEALRIGEDYDLIFRALAQGLKFWIDPFPSYCYRKRASSISHRLGSKEIAALETAERSYLATHPGVASAGVMRASERRLSSLRKAKHWNDLVEALKGRQFWRALRIAMKNPETLPLLLLPLRARASRVRARIKSALFEGAAENGAVYLISRQRLLSATSGSARYVLSLAEALAERGLAVHLVQPSSSVFGRLPVLLRRREAKVFSSIRVRGGIFVGPLLVALDPRISLNFARAALRRALTKAGFSLRDRPAPYSVALPWVAEDFLFTARHVPKLCKAILFDYGFQTVAAPYLAHLGAPAFVIMHDLISSRRAQFARLGHEDSLPAISEAQELQLLTGAGVVVAIQPDEAKFVKARAPGQSVICCPLAVKPVPDPQPGSDHLVLFVGTSTAPNVTGLAWFLSEVWPLVLRDRPSAEFWVAGSVGRSLHKTPPGVKVLGVVPNLAQHYQQAGVVVSPLLSGSGLKIKLIEALAQGKAVVATPCTIRGVERLVAGALAVAERPDAFAGAITSLLSQRGLRRSRAAQALEIVKEHFSAEACYREFVELVANEARL